MTKWTASPDRIWTWYTQIRPINEGIQHLGLHFLTINPYELYEPMDASLWICVWLMWRFLWVGLVVRCILASQNSAAIFGSPKKSAILGSNHSWSRYRYPFCFECLSWNCVLKKISFPTAGNILRTSSSHALPPHVVPHPSRQRVHRSSRCQPELFKTVVTFNYTVELIAYDIQWYIWTYNDK